MVTSLVESRKGAWKRLQIVTKSSVYRGCSVSKDTPCRGAMGLYARCMYHNYVAEKIIR